MDAQEHIDTFYWKNGPCCAGCDWWRTINGMVGLCHGSEPVSGEARADMLGITFSSLRVGAGHIMTKRDHHCGKFKDEFDWSSLPLAYVKRVQSNA